MDTKETQILEAVDAYNKMDILGTQIHCPYWVNKMQGGIVVVRGYENGKGKAESIKKEIERIAVSELTERKYVQSDIYALCVRHKIGIDCSGFVYHILEQVYGEIFVSDFYPLGPRKTNADLLTKKGKKIKNVAEIKAGDLIRAHGGKHVMIIIKKTDTEILYAHSSHTTKNQGVHTSSIRLSGKEKNILDGTWEEISVRNEKWKDIYMNDMAGDGVYRVSN